MGLGANTYGSVAEVEALSRRFTNNGSFDTSTVPTLAQVEKFLDNISATMNLALKGAGFSIPVSEATAKDAIDAFVIEVAADLVHAANSSGRFFTEKALENGVSPLRAVRKEIVDWVEGQIAAFAALGMSRGASVADQIGSREADEAGDTVSPLFQRKAYGNTNKEWDA